MCDKLKNSNNFRFITLSWSPTQFSTIIFLQFLFDSNYRVMNRNAAEICSIFSVCLNFLNQEVTSQKFCSEL